MTKFEEEPQSWMCSLEFSSTKKIFNNKTYMALKIYILKL